MRSVILIIGHWASCNMGDKFQPFVVLNSLREHIKSSEAECHLINLSGGLKDDLTFEIDKWSWIVHTPEHLDRLPKVDYAILTTGSMDRNSRYVGWFSKFLQTRTELKKAYIWGGLSRGYEPFDTWRRGLDFLKDPRLVCLARSELDRQLYKALGGNARLAGDPMAWWVSEPGLQLQVEHNLIDEKALTERSPRHPVVIPSYHAFEYATRRPFWNRVCGLSETNIGIDTYQDRALARFVPSVILDYRPWVLINALLNASHVISGRLHGGVLASCLGIPTTMICVDDAETGLGSLKFEAVSKHALGLDRGLCRMLKPEEGNRFTDSELLSLPETQRLDYLVNGKEYIELTLSTLANIQSDIFG